MFCDSNLLNAFFSASSKGGNCTLLLTNLCRGSRTDSDLPCCLATTWESKLNTTRGKHIKVNQQTYHQQHFLASFREFDDLCSRLNPDVRRKEFSAVFSSSSGKQVLRIKSNTFSTFSPVFALVSKKGFSLKLLFGLPFFSFCSSANLSPADEGISRESFVTRSLLVPTTTTRQFGSEASNSCKWRSCRA